MMKLKQLLRAGVLAAAIAAPCLANAALTTWQYSGTGNCTFGCTGTVNVLGTLTGDPSDNGNPSILGGLELASFSWSLSGAITENYTGTIGLGAYNISGGTIVSGSMTFGDLFALEALDVGSGSWVFSDYRPGAWFSVQLERRASGQGSFQAVPEPGTLALLGLGLAGLGFARRRRSA